jgi:hypothetical protein
MTAAIARPMAWHRLLQQSPGCMKEVASTLLQCSACACVLASAATSFTCS